MPGILSTHAPDLTLAQETPVQRWVSGWLAYLSENLPVIFVVLAVLVGTILLVRGGGLKQALSFAIGAVVVFVVLMNLETIAVAIRNELPLDPPVVESPPAGSPTPAPSEPD